MHGNWGESFAFTPDLIRPRTPRLFANKINSEVFSSLSIHPVRLSRGKVLPLKRALLKFSLQHNCEDHNIELFFEQLIQFGKISYEGMEKNGRKHGFVFRSLSNFKNVLYITAMQLTQQLCITTFLSSQQLLSKFTPESAEVIINTLQCPAYMLACFLFLLSRSCPMLPTFCVLYTYTVGLILHFLSLNSICLSKSCGRLKLSGHSILEHCQKSLCVCSDPQLESS